MTSRYYCSDVFDVFGVLTKIGLVGATYIVEGVTCWVGPSCCTWQSVYAVTSCYLPHPYLNSVQHRNKRKPMENPEGDIERVVQMLVRAASPDVQQAAVRKCVLLRILAPS